MHDRLVISSPHLDMYIYIYLDTFSLLLSLSMLTRDE